MRDEDDDGEWGGGGGGSEIKMLGRLKNNPVVIDY